MNPYSLTSIPCSVPWSTCDVNVCDTFHYICINLSEKMWKFLWWTWAGFIWASASSSPFLSSHWSEIPSSFSIWCCCSVTKLCLTLCNTTDCSTPGFPVLHYLPEFAQIHVHCVSDAIQPAHPLSSPSLPASNLSQHQSLFQWVNFPIRWNWCFWDPKADAFWLH